MRHIPNWTGSSSQKGRDCSLALRNRWSCAFLSSGFTPLHCAFYADARRFHLALSTFSTLPLGSLIFLDLRGIPHREFLRLMKGKKQEVPVFPDSLDRGTSSVLTKLCRKAWRSLFWKRSTVKEALFAAAASQHSCEHHESTSPPLLERGGQKSGGQFSSMPLELGRHVLVCSPVLCYNTCTKRYSSRHCGVPGSLVGQRHPFWCGKRRVLFWKDVSGDTPVVA
jgi:hypothetical protein